MTAMSNEEQFDLDMLQAIRTVARHASGRPDKQDPDVVLARARETIHVQRRRINEVESLHDRRLDQQRKAEAEVEDLKKQVAEARSALDGHRKEIIKLTTECNGHIRTIHEMKTGSPEVAELRSVNESLATQVDELKKRLERETSPVPNMVEGVFPYTMEDVVHIERHRGRTYLRLRGTLDALSAERVKTQQLQRRIVNALKIVRGDAAMRKTEDVIQALDPVPF